MWSTGRVVGADELVKLVARAGRVCSCLSGSGAFGGSSRVRPSRFEPEKARCRAMRIYLCGAPLPTSCLRLESDIRSDLGSPH